MLSALQNIDRTNAIVALFVWLATLSVYLITNAPTLSLWDCGEFIACSSILGIPHPPGSPLYIMIGHIFSVLPLADDPAVRVNLVSCVSSSFTALFGYLIVVRILRAWFDQDKSSYSRFLIYAGAAAGAFFLAFGLTNWNNSVEAEVYGLAMMLTCCILWLALIFLENQGRAIATKVMLLVFFLAFLGIGVHMTTFLILPVVGLFFILKKDTSPSVWFLVSAVIVLELYLIFAMSSRPDEVPYYLPVAIVLVFFLFYTFSFEKIPRVYLLVAGGLLLATAPLLITAVNGVTARMGIDPLIGDGGSDLLDSVGKIALAGLGLFGAWALFKYYTTGKRNRADQRPVLISALFVLVTLMMVGVLSALKGYPLFLMLTAVILLITAALIWRSINWPILIALAGVSMVMIGINLWLIGMAIAAAVILILGLLFRMSGWRTALMVIAVSAVGFSVHTFLPIRSSCDPMINENDPSRGWTATVNYLERKQYGSMSMTERMFKRRAEWKNQFGEYRRMAFWHFFNEQYGLTGSKFIFVFLLGIFGVWEVIRRRPRMGLPLLLLILISSVGLVLYMNFADGTRQHPVTGRDYIEVRDRDYFFTPAFIFFGLVIGIGTSVFIQYIRDSVKKFSPGTRKLISVCLPVLFLLPVATLAGNYHYADRTGNYIPYDYACNVLNSCEPNAVLFTHGDNDTFPLWCAQETYGIRRDVRLVNLSLANLGWYVRQLRDYMNLDLGWSDSDIAGLRGFRSSDGTVFRIQDQVSDSIIARQLRRVPVHFCTSVGLGVRKFRGHHLDSLMRLHGLVWSVPSTDAEKGGVDMGFTIDFYTDPDGFQARGVNDPAVHKDEATERMCRNYGNGFIIVADSLRRIGDFEQAEEVILRGLELVPQAPGIIGLLATMYADSGKPDPLRDLIQRADPGRKNSLTALLGRAEFNAGNDTVAIRVLTDLLGNDPTNRSAYQDLVRYYYSNRDAGSLLDIMQRWLANNPDDERTKRSLEEVRRNMEIQPDTSDDTI